MRTLLLSVLIFFSAIVSGQTKKVRGEVRDKITGKLLSGVRITPDFFGNDTTDLKGRFKIKVPANYKDTISFRRQGYFPFYYRVRSSVPLRIYLLPASGIDTVFHPALQKCMTVKGLVYDKRTHLRLEQASVYLPGSVTIGKTNKEGLFVIDIPTNTDTVIVTHPDYDTCVRRLRNSDRHSKTFIVRLNRTTYYNYDSLWRTNPNTLQVCPFEMFNFGLGIRYTRFIAEKLALGVHTTVYLKFIFGNISLPNRYSGIKVAPLFRLYFTRNLLAGTFFETKLIGGYYSSNDIIYSMDAYNYHYTGEFWTFGAAAAVGYEWYPDGKINVGFTIGIQFLPIGVPKTIHYDGKTYTLGNNTLFPLDNWYIAGPGSIVELKLLIGGLF